MYECPKCHVPLAKWEKFCARCGADLQPLLIENPVCPQCGKTYETGKMYCPDDGAQLMSTEVREKFRSFGGELPNREIMAHARAALHGRWGLAIGTFIIYSLIMLATNIFGILGWLIGLIITGLLMVGLYAFFLSISRKQNASVGQLFYGFNKFGTAIGAYILMGIFVFLWSLLLIIPGIIASLAYSQTYFIVSEHPSVGAMDAIRRSKEMMRGKKGKYFCLGLRFLGWAILCLFTLGIGFLWLVPYIYTSYARFYDDVAHSSAV